MTKGEIRQVFVTIKGSPYPPDPAIDCRGKIVAILRKFHLKNYRGPIDSIEAEITGDIVGFSIAIGGIDVLTERRGLFHLNRGIDLHFREQEEWERVLRYFLDAALTECVVHELHECFLFDGEHVVDPHPERQLRQPATLPLAEIEKAAAELR